MCPKILVPVLPAPVRQPLAQAFMLLAMGFESIRLITFDCYGTLIDWETGMLRSLRSLFARDGRQISDLELLEQYGEVEAALESGEYLPYRQVLSETVQEMGRRLGVTVSSEDGANFAESLRGVGTFPRYRDRSSGAGPAVPAWNHLQRG